MGEACLTPWGKGGQPAREDKSILAKRVSVSAPPRGSGPAFSANFWLVSRQGAPVGAGKQHRPPPHSSSAFPCTRGGFSAASCTLRQPSHGFISSCWRQQLLFFSRALGMPFPVRSGPGETQEQVVRTRNTSVGDWVKTRLFQESRRTKDVKRSAQRHSVDELPDGALLSCWAAASTPTSPSVLRPQCSLRSMGTAGGGTRREEVVTGRQQQPRRCYLPGARNVAPRPGNAQQAWGWIHPT